MIKKAVAFLLYYFISSDYSASSNQCSEVYTGTHPFSEPETLALKNVVESANDKFAFFSFESFGNILFIPYGYTDDQPPNYRELVSIRNYFKFHF